jgi:hypothetical protein
VGDFLYRKRHKVIIETNKYENYKRGVRNTFNKLTESGFITKSTTIRYGFTLNPEFNKRTLLYLIKKGSHAKAALYYLRLTRLSLICAHCSRFQRLYVHKTR